MGEAFMVTKGGVDGKAVIKITKTSGRAAYAALPKGAVIEFPDRTTHTATKAELMTLTQTGVHTVTILSDSY